MAGQPNADIIDLVVAAGEVRWSGIQTAPGAVSPTTEPLSEARRHRRASLWRKRDEPTGWRMYHHQGTPVPPGVD